MLTLLSLITVASTFFSGNGEMTGTSASTVVSASGAQVVHAMPFTPQAPFANWGDPRKADGCEEASITMVAYWQQGRPLSPEMADLEIDRLSSFSEDRFGTFYDQSIVDTQTMLRDFFGIESTLRYDVNAQDIKHELLQGRVVIVPVNGALLGNPYFLDPPPERHMIVVRGYDPIARQFIANEPGTRRGDGFRYGEDVIDRALRDYATGYRAPIPPRRTALLSVPR